jgi:hypothetical protein
MARALPTIKVMRARRFNVFFLSSRPSFAVD